jgi:hypothetical protein
VDKGHERRRLKRHKSHVPVEFRSPALRGAGEITNLSKNGLFIRARLLPIPGDELSITIRPGSPSAFEVTGAVCWNTDQLPEAGNGSPGFGVRIAEPGPRFAAFFEELLLK